MSDGEDFLARLFGEMPEGIKIVDLTPDSGLGNLMQTLGQTLPDCGASDCPFHGSKKDYDLETCDKHLCHVSVCAPDHLPGPTSAQVFNYATGAMFSAQDDISAGRHKVAKLRQEQARLWFQLYGHLRVREEDLGLEEERRALKAQAARLQAEVDQLRSQRDAGGAPSGDAVG